MGWLIRAGVYLLSGFTIWQFVQGPADVAGLHKHLSLDQVHGMVLGVCAGISNYTGIDVSLIRLVWALSVFYRGIGIALYILAFLIMPVS
ncbi:MAG TPA: PspC domain-containing protein [Methylomusa anaerophila]|uniref:Phage shock protein C n=1 Tax=Methylomusa anaerophila TaxID=1930071 RepID=A0A348AI02_9FIRM|nr:PspC domain-containing protein [Methylomusa anaerophila]BBB90700.1 phage shock protein C [Methylomusa anaerophila]HML88697.1 PspC domain-containing protein [Methylomusa anaerophila]